MSKDKDRPHRRNRERKARPQHQLARIDYARIDYGRIIVTFNLHTLKLVDSACLYLLPDTEAERNAYTQFVIDELIGLGCKIPDPLVIRDELFNR